MAFDLKRWRSDFQGGWAEHTPGLKAVSGGTPVKGPSDTCGQGFASLDAVTDVTSGPMEVLRPLAADIDSRMLGIHQLTKGLVPSVYATCSLAHAIRWGDAIPRAEFIAEPSTPSGIIGPSLAEKTQGGLSSFCARKRTAIVDVRQE